MLTTLATVDVFDIYSKLFVESHQFNLPHLHLTPPLRGGVTAFEFAKIFGIRKLDSLGYRVALFA